MTRQETIYLHTILKARWNQIDKNSEEASWIISILAQFPIKAEE